jgi:peptide deformylase
MVYPIYVYGSTVLRKIAKDIPQDFDGLDQLIEDMFETMAFSEGVGLAAPQIGKSIRLFCIDATRTENDDEEEDGEEYESLKDFKKAFINPQIIEETGSKWMFNEGCLSIPLLREDVERHSRIRIQYYDPDWNFHDEVYDGVKARIIQHEYDHLEGVMFVDRINPLRKKLIKGRLNAITKGKVDIDYKIRIPSK